MDESLVAMQATGITCCLLRMNVCTQDFSKFLFNSWAIDSSPNDLYTLCSISFVVVVYF